MKQSTDRYLCHSKAINTSVQTSSFHFIKRKRPLDFTQVVIFSYICIIPPKSIFKFKEEGCSLSGITTDGTILAQCMLFLVLICDE